MKIEITTIVETGDINEDGSPKIETLMIIGGTAVDIRDLDRIGFEVKRQYLESRKLPKPE